MAVYNKGTWLDRVSENPTRRSLTVTSATGSSGLAVGDVITADVARADTNVSVEGTAFNHTNMDGYETKGSTLLVNFLTPVTTMQAGVPYLVKVDRGDGSNLVDPVFNNVTINATQNYHYVDGMYFEYALYYEFGLMTTNIDGTADKP